MALEKLRAITAHLLAANLVSAEQLDSWMESGELETASKNLGNGGIRICRLKYDAVIYIERYTKAPELLMVLVSTWVMDHDPERYSLELGEPKMDIDVINERMADVEIKIPFYENVDLVVDGNGPVSFNGQQWQIASTEIDAADQVAVGDDQQQPTDAPYVAD